MKVDARSFDPSIEAVLRPMRVVIFILGGSTRLPLLAILYVLGLIAVVAFMVCFPLSTFPLLVLWAWLIPFFLFALAVIACSSILIARIYGRIAVGLYQRACRCAPRAKPSAPAPGARTAGVWDRWLDG
jgi:hypothetical protein